MSKNRDTYQKAITEVQRSKMWNLFLQGKYQDEIGKELDIPRSTVGYHIRQTLTEYRSANLTSAGNYIAAELETCNTGEAEAWKIYFEAWRAWESSKGTHEVVTESGKALNRKDGKPRLRLQLDSTTTEIQVKKEKLVGDPRLLKIALEAQEQVKKWHERRCKLLGIENPKAPLGDLFGGMGADVTVTTARQIIISELSIIASRSKATSNPKQING